LDGDPPPVVEHEGGNVHRVGEGMFGKARPGHAVDAPARIGAERLDPRQPGAERSARQRRHVVAHPGDEAVGELAGHGAEMGHGQADVGELDRAEGRAAAGIMAIFEPAEARAPAGQVVEALAQRHGARLALARPRVAGRRHAAIAMRDTAREQQQRRRRYHPPLHPRIVARRQRSGQPRQSRTDSGLRRKADAYRRVSGPRRPNAVRALWKESR
jgi:hypothetical protein